MLFSVDAGQLALFFSFILILQERRGSLSWEKKLPLIPLWNIFALKALLFCELEVILLL
jgi:hypothetical protein